VRWAANFEAKSRRRDAGIAEPCAAGRRRLVSALVIARCPANGARALLQQVVRPSGQLLGSFGAGRCSGLRTAPAARTPISAGMASAATAPPAAMDACGGLLLSSRRRPIKRWPPRTMPRFCALGSSKAHTH
jgi:hypothetical protein